MPGHKIGVSFVCLIHCLVTSLRATFLDGVLGRVCRPIGHVVSQSRSHVPSSSVPTEAADPTVPANPNGDLLSDDPSDIPIPPSQPIVLIDILSSSTFVLHLSVDSILASASITIDSSVGQMFVLIEQQAQMMVKITQLRVASERHTVEYTTLHGVIHIQQRIQWMCDESNDANDAAVD